MFIRILTLAVLVAMLMSLSAPILADPNEWDMEGRGPENNFGQPKDFAYYTGYFIGVMLLVWLGMWIWALVTGDQNLKDELNKIGQKKNR